MYYEINPNKVIKDPYLPLHQIKKLSWFYPCQTKNEQKFYPWIDL
jgi:hypothetical protein